MKTRPLACVVVIILLFGAFAQPPANGWQDEGVVESVPLPVWYSETLTTGAHVYRLGAPALANASNDGR